jgi:hypothetical protein
MTKQLSVYDAFLDCLHVLGDVHPSQRYKVVDALHRMQNSPEGSRVLSSEPLTPLNVDGCCYEDCTLDAGVIIGSTPFCRYHAADGLLSGMEKEERVHLVSIHVSSDELIDAEGLPS